MNWYDLSDQIKNITIRNEQLQSDLDRLISELLLFYSEVCSTIYFNPKPVKCYIDNVILCWITSISWDEVDGKIENITFDLYHDYSEEVEEDVPYKDVIFDRLMLIQAIKRVIEES